MVMEGIVQCMGGVVKLVDRSGGGIARRIRLRND